MLWRESIPVLFLCGGGESVCKWGDGFFMCVSRGVSLLWYSWPDGFYSTEQDPM